MKTFLIRLDEKTAQKLDKLEKKLNMGKGMKSAIIRKLINGANE
jgi:hypothetical protein